MKTTKKVIFRVFASFLFGLVITTGYFANFLTANIASYLPANIAKAATSPTIYIQASQTDITTSDQITASVMVDGAGQSFTSFKANISLTNLTVVGNLTLGPSVTNWQAQPNSSSLNFFGGVQGATTNITVYTMLLQPTSAGAASILVSSGYIYQVQQDGITINNILSSVSGASFTVSAPASVVATPTPTATPKATPKPTVKKTATPTPKNSATPTPTATPVITPTPIEVTATPIQATPTPTSTKTPLVDLWNDNLNDANTVTTNNQSKIIIGGFSAFIAIIIIGIILLLKKPR